MLVEPGSLSVFDKTVGQESATLDDMNSRDHFHAAAEPFTDVVEAVPVDAWSSPSPCEGWSAKDVVDHVITTQNDCLAGQQLPTVTVQGDPAEQWRTQRTHVAELLADPTIADREYDGAMGRTTIGATLGTFYGFDLIVHRWDVARAVGTDTQFTDDELELLESSIAGFGDHLYAEGICRPPVTVDPDASRQRRVLGLLGRTA
ncbi:MAG: TIGR03086 family metal-binding protein [Propionibacteriales bacterium]|nr:TIGR03086 family metal-binding protein [Propionibacteriales bacterium]